MIWQIQRARAATHATQLEPAAQGMVAVLLSPQMLTDLSFFNQKCKADGGPVFVQPKQGYFNS